MKNKTVLFILILSALSVVLIITDISLRRFSTSETAKIKGGKDFGFNFLKSGSGSKYIKIFRIEGVLTTAGEESLFGFRGGADYYAEEIEKCSKDDMIAGILLRINSPGGAVCASQEIFNALNKFKRTTGKPVIASMAEIAASGGYHIASAADSIFAGAGTLTGSIGVIIGGVTIQKLIDKIGIEPNVYTSDKHKDIMSPYRQPTAEEKKIMNDMVKTVYDQFLKDVKSSRKNKFKKPDKELFDGRIFSGIQALEFGLVDYIGGYSESLEYLWTLTGNTGEPVIKTGDSENFFVKLLNESLFSNNIFKTISKRIEFENSPSLKYLYRGDLN
ncbi:MAG TPA: signal peptide peptidase SppA [bacterium]|nr:signal peptide peptidase SppA [bacterium]